MSDKDMLDEIPGPDQRPKPIKFRVLSAEECKARDAARGPDQLGVALLQAQADKDAARSAVEALKAEERKAREVRETEIARLHQQELQRRQTEQEDLENKRHQIAAWQRLDKIRESAGLPRIEFDDFK